MPKQRLRELAAAHGRSVEAEAHAILVDTLFAEDFVVHWLKGASAAPDSPDLETLTGRPTGTRSTSSDPRRYMRLTRAHAPLA